MTCSDSSTLPSVHLLQFWITQNQWITQNKFEIPCSVMLWTSFKNILVHLGAFWCASYATPWPLHDLLWLLCPSKHPFTPEIDHMSHSGQISNYFALRCNGAHFVLFGPFWCILVHLMCNPMTPPWLALTPIPFQVSIYSRNWSHKSLRTNSRCFAQSWYSDHFGPFWSILVHIMGDPTTPLYWIVIKSSKTCVQHTKSFYSRPIPPS